MPVPPSAIPQNAQLSKPWKSSLYDPMVLYAETTLVTGSDVSPNTAALANPHSLPMELLGVKFRIHTLNTTNDAVQNILVPGSVTGLGVGVKMDMGALQLVDAGVPIGLLGTARDDSEDGPAGYGVFSTSAQVVAYSSDKFGSGSSPIAGAYDFHWRLQKPMYIPPSGVVVPLFSHLTQVPYDINIGVTYYCRTFRESRKEPSHVYVPWVSKYLSKSFDVATGTNAADSDESSELDIRNPFPDAAVELQRLSGRFAYSLTGSSAEAPNVVYEYAEYEKALSGQIYEHTRMRIRSSRGDELTRAPTLFGGVFPQVSKTWDFPPGWCMQPNEYYKVFLDRAAFTGPTSAADTGRVQFAVGAVGFRKINTSTLRGAP